MFKLIAVLMVLSSGDPEDAGLKFTHNQMFESAAACESFKDSEDGKRDQAALAFVVRRLSVEQQQRYTARFSCELVEDDTI